MPPRISGHPLTISYKYIVCFMVWLSFTLLVGSRYSLRNIVLIEVSYHNNSSSSRNVTICGEYLPPGSNTKLDLDIPIWEWTKYGKFYITYAFRIGYMISQVPVGALCDLYGPRHFLGIGLLASSVINAAIPLTLHRTLWIQTAALMFLNGLAQGFCSPAAFSLLARWIPKRQLTFLASLAYSGVTTGNTLSKFVSAYFATHVEFWPGPFYLWFGVILIWYLVFVNIIFSSPSSHPYLRAEEKQQLIKEFGTTAPCRVPWPAIIKDCALWAILSAQIGYKILQAAIEFALPVFAVALYNIDLKFEPHYLFIPMILRCAVIIPCGILGDYLINRDIIPTVYLRSIYIASGNIVSSFLFLLSTFMNCHRELTLACDILAVLCTSLYFSGIAANIVDRTRNYAGFFAGIQNALSTLATTLSSQLVLKIIVNNNINDWSNVCWFILAACIFTTVIYLMWSKGEPAKWDVVQTKEQIRRANMRKQ